MKKVLLVLSFLFIASSAYASDGNTLYTTCTVRPTDYNTNAQQLSAMASSGICLGYIEGVVESGTPFTTLVPYHSPDNKLFFCLPKNTTPVQLKDIVVKYLTANPEFRSKQAPMLVIEAMKEAFPCQDSTPIPLNQMPH